MEMQPHNRENISLRKLVARGRLGQSNQGAIVEAGSSARSAAIKYGQFSSIGLALSEMTKIEKGVVEK